jgi:hypothetical protein
MSLHDIIGTVLAYGAAILLIGGTLSAAIWAIGPDSPVLPPCEQPPSISADDLDHLP